jgi:hypothetical protein
MPVVVTGDDVISEALILIGVKYAGQTISVEAKATSLLGLNLLLSEWNATGQAVYSVEREIFNLQAGVADYTIGPSGTFVTARPEKIETWSVATAQGTSDGGKPLDSASFERVADDRALVGSRVKALNYDAAFPDGNIHIYPIPNGGQTISLWVWVQLAEVTDSSLELTFPFGYLKAIIYNLAVDLAPKFGREVPQTVKLVADQTKQALAATNASEHTPPAQAA